MSTTSTSETIIYTGEGGRDSETGQQVADQTLSDGNEALVNSGLEGTPVRVFRRTGRGREYRYDGPYYVERYWPDRPAERRSGAPRRGPRARGAAPHLRITDNDGNVSPIGERALVRTGRLMSDDARPCSE